jgi:hypothetical protein
VKRPRTFATGAKAKADHLPRAPKSIAHQNCSKDHPILMADINLSLTLMVVGIVLLAIWYS